MRRSLGKIDLLTAFTGQGARMEERTPWFPIPPGAEEGELVLECHAHCGEDWRLVVDLTEDREGVSEGVACEVSGPGRHVAWLGLRDSTSVRARICGYTPWSQPLRVKSAVPVMAIHFWSGERS